MNTIDRRTFLSATAGTLASTTVARPTIAGATGSAKNPWKKAFMLGNVTKGSPLASFQLLKEAGFDGVELISPNDLDLNDVLSARDKTGLTIHGVSGGRHWQDTLADADPQVVARGMAAIRKEFADCKTYGGTTVLLVPAVVNTKVGYRDAYKRSQERIRELLPDAEKHGIKIAIENVWNKFLLSPLEFTRYIDDFNSPWVGAYFDVGNIIEYGNPEDWIRELGKRILKVHIKEYNREKRFKCRLGEGGIDWMAVRTALSDVGYDGWVTAEVGYEKLEGMKDIVRRMNELLQLA